MARTDGSPVGAPLQVAALGAALLTGALGWVALPVLYLTLPPRMMPIAPSEWGNWPVGIWAALIIFLLGGSATAGVALEERLLREPTPFPGRRWGLRGWLSLALSLLGLAAGVSASLQFTGAAGAGFSAVVDTWFHGDPTGIPVALALGATAGAGPTLGLLAARALGRRWRLDSGSRGESPPEVSGDVPVGQFG